MLLERFPTAVVPVRFEGTRDALPPGRVFPRFCAVRIIIGKLWTADELLRAGHGEKAHERIANGLQQKVAELSRITSNR